MSVISNFYTCTVCIESIEVGLYENSRFSTHTLKSETIPMPTLLETTALKQHGSIQFS
jgi:hypothetical protein